MSTGLPGLDRQEQGSQASSLVWRSVTAIVALAVIFFSLAIGVEFHAPSVPAIAIPLAAAGQYAMACFGPRVSVSAAEARRRKWVALVLLALLVLLLLLVAGSYQF